MHGGEGMYEQKSTSIGYMSVYDSVINGQLGLKSCQRVSFLDLNSLQACVLLRCTQPIVPLVIYLSKEFRCKL